MNKEIIFESVKQHKDEFVSKLGTFDDYKIEGICNGFPPNSIFFSEALVLYSLAKYYEIDVLVESGVFRGGSTLIWGRTLPELEIRAFDILESEKHANFWPKVKESLSIYPNLNFEVGDGHVVLPKFIEENKDKKIGVFVDGPKDQQGLRLAQRCTTYDNVCFASLHDYTYTGVFDYFSTAISQELADIVGDINKKHPQIHNYPNGPGLTIL